MSRPILSSWLSPPRRHARDLATAAPTALNPLDDRPDATVNLATRRRGGTGQGSSGVTATPVSWRSTRRDRGRT